jgi:CspA family cold shock protein
MSENVLERISGTVERYYSDRGFGFIRPDGTETEIFVHISDLQAACIDRIVRSERLSFNIIEGKSGRPQAVNIEELMREGN